MTEFSQCFLIKKILLNALEWRHVFDKNYKNKNKHLVKAFFSFCSVQFCSIQFKMISVRSEKPIMRFKIVPHRCQTSPNVIVLYVSLSDVTYPHRAGCFRTLPGHYQTSSNVIVLYASLSYVT